MAIFVSQKEKCDKCGGVGKFHINTDGDLACSVCSYIYYYKGNGLFVSPSGETINVEGMKDVVPIINEEIKETEEENKSSKSERIFNFVYDNPNEYTYVQVAKRLRCTSSLVRYVAIRKSITHLFVVSDITKKRLESVGKGKNYCVDCRREITFGAVRCRECFSKRRDENREAVELKFCIDCGRKISPSAIRCMKCSSKRRYKEKKILEVSICVDCGKKISQGSARCRACNSKKRKEAKLVLAR